MKSKIFLIFFIILFSSLPALAAYQIDTEIDKDYIPQEAIDCLTWTGRALAMVAERVKPAVVNISTIKSEKIREDPFREFRGDPFFRKFFERRFGIPRERRWVSLGSGVIVSEDGYILTNYHVIKNAEKIIVVLSDKSRYTGRVIGSDPETDLSVIKIDAEGLKTIPFGDSDKLKVGEIVLAIGNPYGLNQTITMGIVSAVGRANVGIADYEDFIQTDAAINPGNSGGALVNSRGELIGINTAIFSTSGGYQGIGFAIPSNMAKIVMRSLIMYGRVIRGWLGVSIQEITPELAMQFGLEKGKGTLVADVVDGGPADMAGLMRGDIIIKFDGKEVNDPFTLRNLVANTPPGATVNLTVIREGEEIELEVTIGELPTTEQLSKKTIENALRGVSVQNLTPDIYRQLNLPPKIRGVVVTEVEPGSPAETSLFPGDVILEINRRAISNIDDYEQIVSEIKPDQDILLLIYRRGSTLFITISTK